MKMEAKIEMEGRQRAQPIQYLISKSSRLNRAAMREY
jgi:hypothetical protein